MEVVGSGKEAKMNKKYVVELTEDEREKMIGEVFDMSNSTFRLLENILLWSREQSEGIVFKPTEFILKDILNEHIQEMHVIAVKKEITLEASLDSSLKIKADKEMLNTILRNLISNAIKFTNRGGKVTLNACKDEGEVVISVHDNGIGMSAEKIASLFHLGKKDNTMGTEKERGSGFGLILCKEFVEKHGGKIRIESTLGEGTLFTFTIPQ